jgi:hypothetical protein
MPVERASGGTSLIDTRTHEAVLAENVKLKAQLAASTPSKRRRAE